MRPTNQPWSKRIWYGAALVAMLTLMIGNIIVILILNVISIVIISIVSISLKRKELNVLIQHSTSPDQAPDVPQQEHVILHGVQYQVRSKSLELKNKGIKNLLEIEGLDKLWYLKKLDLSYNHLSSMKGLETLINLRVLKLSHNKIQNIESISSLRNLQIILLDNNQLTEFHQSDLPQEPIFKKIDISMNPIEKFDIYLVSIYNALKFGPKKWFPKQELKRLRKQIKRMKGTSSFKKHSSKEVFTIFIIYFTIWAIIAFLLALVINLAFWGITTGGNANYWRFLFTQGLWTFLVGGFGSIIVIVLFRLGVVY
ncbi:MAG: leucine-rich repeat domain-containing protein [Promethearchaeota archaeon]